MGGPEGREVSSGHNQLLNSIIKHPREATGKAGGSLGLSCSFKKGTKTGVWGGSRDLNSIWGLTIRKQLK